MGTYRVYLAYMTPIARAVHAMITGIWYSIHPPMPGIRNLLMPSWRGPKWGTRFWGHFEGPKQLKNSSIRGVQHV